MIPWMLVFVVVMIAAGIGVGMLCTILRVRHPRLLLGACAGDGAIARFAVAEG